MALDVSPATSPLSPHSEDLENPALFQRGRLPPRARFLPSTDNCININGRWQFAYFATPQDAWASLTADDTSWGEIRVPGHWQLQGHGRPQYTNTRFPFPVDPPHIPTANPTGLYQRFIQVPQAWTDGSSPTKLIRLRLDGVDSSYHLYLDNTLVGYSQGSRNAAEFDITKHAAAANGKSMRLRVVVYQWCDGSYLEDQDMWWLSGIFRDVNILAFPAFGRIEDYKVETKLDERYQDATVHVGIRFEAAARDDFQIKVELSGQQVDGIIADDITVKQESPETPGQFESTFRVSNPKKWTAETPHLYALSLRLFNKAGEEIQTIKERVGFRQVEIIKGNITVNGVPILLNGANRHDHHPRYGRAVPASFVRKDLLLMKKHNLNAIRCSHYPSMPELYSMCDELGIYVMDEADVECHGFFDAVARDLDYPDWAGYHERKHKCLPLSAKFTSDNPDWRDAYLDRAERLVKTNQNRPSVIIWSLGNEAFYGSNHKAMYEWIKMHDPTRPIHYEGDKNAASADMYSYMYPSMGKLEHWADFEGDDFAKPIVVCEYAHSKGNGPGNLQEYQDLFRSKRRLQGGYIWEWADHGLINVHNGEEYYAYGGDFGESLHDGKYCMDGVVTSDHNPTPGLLEYKKVIQPMDVTREDDKTLMVKNWYDFVDLGHCAASWMVLKCGSAADSERVLGSGIMQLPHIGPGQKVALPNPFFAFESHDVDPGDHLYGNLNFLTSEPTAWAPAGHEVAWAQFELRKSSNIPRSPAYSGGLEVDDRTITRSLVISGANFSICFDRTTGHITEWITSGRSILHNQGGPKLGIWRPPTDNDLALHALQWQKHGLDSLEISQVQFSFSQSEQAVQVQVKFRLSPPVVISGFHVSMEYTIDSEGGMIIAVDMCPIRENPKSLPRIGIDLSLSEDFESVVWHGLGPHQSYKDSNASVRKGIYSSPIADLDFLYEVPQENGNRSDVEWVSILDAYGRGFRATFKDRTFNFQASHYYPDNVTKARHIYELVRRTTTHLRLDYDHHGLGNASISPFVLPAYELKNQPVSFVVELRPV